MYKKIMVAIGLLFLMLSAMPSAFAQDYGLDATARKAQYSQTTNIYSMISMILQIVLSVVGIVFLAIMFYAGLRWMTGRGNEEHATKAKDAMFNATMGFVLVVVAYALTVFIFNKLLQ